MGNLSYRKTVECINTMGTIDPNICAKGFAAGEMAVEHPTGEPIVSKWLDSLRSEIVATYGDTVTELLRNPAFIASAVLGALAGEGYFTHITEGMET